MPEVADTSKRSHERSRVLLKAVVKEGPREISVRVRNISVLGALLESESPPALGDDVRLVRGELDCICRVTWVEGSRFGVSFHCPILPSEVLAQIGTTPKFEPPPTYKRPGFTGVQLEGHELRVMRAVQLDNPVGRR